jgi:hypothetical protein
MFDQAERYRRLAIEARQQAARSEDKILRVGFEEIADNWFTLAEQAEWLAGQADKLLSPQAQSPTAHVTQHQQQIQPKKIED